MLPLPLLLLLLMMMIMHIAIAPTIYKEVDQPTDWGSVPFRGVIHILYDSASSDRETRRGGGARPAATGRSIDR
jgi:hypothetical protein